MITDTLSNIISKDKTCLLGLAKLDKSKYLYSIAPLNKSYIYPKVISKIDNSYNETKPLEIFGEWSTEAGIYETSNCFLNDDNFDIPTNKVYSTSDWTIKTLLSLSNEADENNLNLIKNDYTILSLMKLASRNAPNTNNVTISWEEDVVVNEDPYETQKVTRSETLNFSREVILSGYVSNGTPRSNSIKRKVDEIIENGTIQIFKQGRTNLNGVFDCYARIFQDSNGYYGDINIIVYYHHQNEGSVLKHVMKINFVDAAELLDKFHLFSIKIDSSNGYIGLYMDNEIIKEDSLDLTLIENPILNYPISNEEDDYKFVIGGKGATKFELSNIFIFNRILTHGEVEFLNKIIGKNVDESYYEYDWLKPLTFVSQDDNSLIKFEIFNSQFPIQYRFGENDDWKDYESNYEIVLNKNEVVQFQSTISVEKLNEFKNNYDSFIGIGHFSMNGTFKSYGNIQSLLNYVDFCFTSCFHELFNECNGLIKAPDLPALNLAKSCYSYMFRKTGIKETPKLLANVLAEDSYKELFCGCEDLIKINIINAKILAKGCCEKMFGDCLNLEIGPVLFAEDLVQECYREMFWNCPKLRYLKVYFNDWNEVEYSTERWFAVYFENDDYFNDDIERKFYKKSLLEVSNRTISTVPEKWSITDF